VIEAEMIGGPCDGARYVLSDDNSSEVIIASSWSDGPLFSQLVRVDHRYLRRKIDGIYVRLPSGHFPYDHCGFIVRSRLPLST
jgi:hypothetical protein